MTEDAAEEARAQVDALYRSDSRSLLATLIRLVGDWDLAEDSLHDAFREALEQWPIRGLPDNPRTWLISTARFKAIDVIRRRARFDASEAEISEQFYGSEASSISLEENAVKDDRLRLIFTCCHPFLAEEARIALTLREVCGLTTEQIASAFLATPTAVAQRIVRAKAKIKEAKILYRVPEADELPGRLDTVFQVIYLVFNEGYSASSGNSLTRADLSGEAIRLGRLLHELLPEPEVAGLLALMLLQESRRAARTSASGDLLLLEVQDRALWDTELIQEAKLLVESALTSRRFGGYTLQAAIAAVHAEAKENGSTDWTQIVALYTFLARENPSPVILLNRAVAVAMLDGPQAGLKLIDDLLSKGHLEDYHLAHSARADLCRRLGKAADAAKSYTRALELAQQEPTRRFLQVRLKELDAKDVK